MRAAQAIYEIARATRTQNCLCGSHLTTNYKPYGIFWNFTDTLCSTEVARGLGKTIRQVRDATDEIKTEIQHTVQHGSSAGNSLLEETQKEIEQIKEDIEEIKEEVAGNHLPKD